MAFRKFMRIPVRLPAQQLLHVKTGQPRETWVPPTEVHVQGLDGDEILEAGLEALSR